MRKMSASLQRHLTVPTPFWRCHAQSFTNEDHNSQVQEPNNNRTIPFDKVRYRVLQALECRMALRFHARHKILRKFRLASRIPPARYRAKAALLNSRTTPSKELTGHVTIYSHVVYPTRQNTESFNFCLIC